MIREIIQFVNFLEDDFPEAFELNQTPSPGLHLWVDLDENGNWRNNDPEENIDYIIYDAKQEMKGLLFDAAKYESLQDYLTMNKQKAFDKSQKIHSASPFAVSFNLKLNDQDKLNIKNKTNTEEASDTNWNIICHKACLVKSAINEYFDNTRRIFLGDNHDELKFISMKFQSHICNVIDWILSIENENGEKLLKNFKESFYVRIYLKNIDQDKIRELHSNYIRDNIFNKKVYNEEGSEGVKGVIDFMNTFANNKPFLIHQTAFFKKGINYRFSNEGALCVRDFEKLVRNKILPNPLPLFINKNEFKIGSEIVKIFTNTSSKISYSDILKGIFEQDEKRILGNYYLLNLESGKNLVVHDFDFVSNFQYLLKNCEILNFFSLRSNDELAATVSIKNIFHFEAYVVRKIFNNALVKESKNGLSYQYFNDVDPNYVSGGDEIYQLILRFRKAFYDYIYKSRKQAVNQLMFDEILWKSILSDLREDEVKEKYHTKERQIKEKLNIWFSLDEFFTNQKKEKTMASRYNELLAKMKEIANNESILIEDDTEFLFASGQIIYFLLSRSKASNPTHALLESFLQKNTASQLQNAIAQTINTYKHDIQFGKGRFEKLCAQVLAYDTAKPIKDIQRFLLAGYFAPAVIYSKKDQELETEVINN